ncbi:MAG: cyclic nucleotide-binding domain-containing protein, partial [Actinomycetota bacterium]|nr:cyclic nucleotide-binding domain-containing protein [Actinomycetota bacterium]
MNLAELFHHATGRQLLPAGQTLFKEGESGDLMYILMTGTADIIVHDRVMESAGPGTLLGEMAMIDAAPRSATVLATSECTFLPISRDRFNFLVQQTPNFALHVMR